MALKFIVDNLEQVAEEHRGLYKQIDGGKFQLNVDGAVDKARLDEFRTNNVELQKQIDKYKDVDPVKYRELMAIQQKIVEKELLDKGEVDKLVELRTRAMREELTNNYTTAKNELDTAQAMLSKLQVNDVVKTAALKVGIHATAVDDVINRATAVFKIEKGVPVPKNPDGTVIFDKSGDKPITVETWLHDLKKSAPHLFVGAIGSGAGGGTNTGGKDIGSMSAIEKISVGLAQGGMMSPEAAGLK